MEKRELSLVGKEQKEKILEWIQRRTYLKNELEKILKKTIDEYCNRLQQFNYVRIVNFLTKQTTHNFCMTKNGKDVYQFWLENEEIITQLIREKKIKISGNLLLGTRAKFLLNILVNAVVKNALEKSKSLRSVMNNEEIEMSIFWRLKKEVLL